MSIKPDPVATTLNELVGPMDDLRDLTNWTANVAEGLDIVADLLADIIDQRPDDVIKKLVKAARLFEIVREANSGNHQALLGIECALLKRLPAETVIGLRTDQASEPSKEPEA